MATTKIRFDATLHALNRRVLLRLPIAASKKLPSRGQVAVHGTINGQSFDTVIEPDGDFGHWLNVDTKLQKAAGLRVGETAQVEVEPSSEWPEPRLPPDLKRALSSAPSKVRDLWQSITPMARWEWVRWINATANPATRERRVVVTVSKMSKGSRRPCCFNLASCTDPELSKSGKLVAPE
ncbi:MAG: YdeI/OmpD-associated family protein [Myxococcales bacterium]